MGFDEPGGIVSEDRRPCPFCSPPPGRVLVEHDLALVVRDGFPVSKGHRLVVPRRHVASLFDLDPEEQAAIWMLVEQAQQAVRDELHPDGVNIGLNDGYAAGQTVMHAHVHVIPRYAGDVADPRGGVRWVLPENARYWKD